MVDLEINRAQTLHALTSSYSHEQKTKPSNQRVMVLYQSLPARIVYQICRSKVILKSPRILLQVDNTTLKEFENSQHL